MTSHRKFIAAVTTVLLSATAAAQTQPTWTVSVTPSLNPLPIGMCGAVRLRIFDPATRDVPRNPQGMLITLADFDLSVDGVAIAGNQIDPYHYDVCGCPGGSPGSSGKVTATYPAQSLAANARVRGVQIAVEAPVVLAEPKGSSVPRACASVANDAARGVAIQSAGNFTPLPQTATAARGQPDPFAPAARTTTTQTGGGVGGAAPPPAMVNPSGFTSFQTGPNTVLLHWQPVSGVAYYGLFGPGLPQGGVKVANATAYTATQVPAGSNEWAVASYYEPGRSSTAAANFPRVTLNVTGPAAPAATAATAPPSGDVAAAACNMQAAQSSSSSLQNAALGGQNLLSQLACPPSSSAANNPPPAVPPGASGRYLVTVLGFRAYAVSADDPLSRDGFGDEAYAAAYIRRYDRRTEKQISATTCRTRTYGDVAVANSATISNSCGSSTGANPQAEVSSGSSQVAIGMPRIQGGNWMPTGGIRDYDMIPNGPAVAARSQTPKDNAFPWRLWEGTLIDGVDALVITPSLWEQDGAVLGSSTITEINQALQQQTQAFYNQWRQQQQTIDSSIFSDTLVQGQITGKRFGMIAAGAQANSSNTAAASVFFNQVATMAAHGIPLAALLGSGADRPIGLVSTGFDQTALPNRLVVLTREIIEAALAGPALGVIPSTIPNVAGVAAPVRGVIMVPFYDGRMPLGSQGLTFLERPAMYQMFIQVERLP
jgi:hypothetical protein